MNRYLARTSITFCVMLTLTLLSFAGCGNQKETVNKLAPADLLSESFTNTELIRSSEVRTFTGQTLYEHINGGAEVYHLYSFIDVSNAYYKIGETEISADIYRFANANMTFGLFSTLRPPEPEPIGLGADGFKSASAATFIKDQFMIRLTGFDETEATSSAIKTLAEEIAPTIPGSSELPSILNSLPMENRIPHTQRMTAVDYLGWAGVNGVYSIDYSLNSESFTLFIAEDNSGGKFAAWQGQLKSDPNLLDALEGFSFDDPYKLSTSSSFSGTTVAGLKSGKLAGVIGYENSIHQFIAQWIDSLN